MAGKLYKGRGEVVTPYLGAELVNAMYIGNQYVGYNSQYSTYISASGGTITIDGDYKIHRFNSSSVFTVHSAPLSSNNAFEVLVVGGGAGGGCRNEGTSVPGGGGGGAVVHIPLNANFRLDAGAYNVVVGAGGLGQIDGGTDRNSTDGSPSYVTSSAVSVYALGGFRPTAANTFTSQSSLAGVSGQYGHNFPNGNFVLGANQSPGGGGAGEPGGEPGVTCTPVGNGGDGYEVTTLPYNENIDGNPTDFWGGGGAGQRYPNQPGCPAGAQSATQGDGGAGDAGTNGIANSGGGGGANSSSGGGSTAGNGGSGTVIIRYKFQ